MKASIRHFALLSIVTAFAAPAAHADVVLATSPSGDAYSNGGQFNQGSAIGASGWYYNNVRNGATIGISGSNPRAGNGSVSFNAPGNGKADIEYLAGATLSNGNYAAQASLGALAALQSMSYEWFREGSSSASDWLHPSLRVLIDRDGNLNTSDDRGGLVFEQKYNLLDPNAVWAKDAWVSESIGGQSFVWSFGALGNPDGNGYAYDSTLADWQAFLPNALIIGFSSGVGSGWAPFSGAVDNISWTIGGVTTTSNFELAAADVPEPATLGLLAIGMAGLALRRRRQN